MIRHMTVIGQGVSYKTESSAGFDIKSTECIVIKPGDVGMVSTGLFVTMVLGDSEERLVTELQIRPRSGLALKHKVTVVNSPGTVDEDFPNEIKVLLINHGTEDFVVNMGDRIAQGVFAVVYRPYNIPIEQVVRTGGFGSTHEAVDNSSVGQV